MKKHSIAGADILPLAPVKMRRIETCRCGQKFVRASWTPGEPFCSYSCGVRYQPDKAKAGLRTAMGGHKP